jgi:anaerobic C4-dicarboxylate transporter DcuB
MSLLTHLNEGTQFLLQLLVVLVCLFYGARKGGVALGLLGGIGLLVLVFGFGVAPGEPATSVMLTILAVVAAGATLQASGGLDVMLQVAEKVLRRNPKYVSILAPLVTCTLTILCGTGHVVYTILPIIYDVSIKNNVRPERPMAASSVSAQMGIMASPVSVGVVTLSGMLMEAGMPGFTSPLDLLKVSIPSTFLGVLAIGIFSMFRGKPLEKDERFQNFIADPENRASVYGGEATLLGKKLPGKSWAAMWIFLSAIVVVALMGAVKSLRPSFTVDGETTTMSMTLIIQMFMLVAGAIIIIVTRCDANSISKNDVFRSGMIALVAVFGISWMADSMFESHTAMVESTVGSLVISYPWAYAVMLLLVSKFVNSQAAAISAFVPVAIQAGVPFGIIVAFASAAYGYYILPTYPSDLAAIQFDRSGTTHIGKYVINHSFIIPGLLGVTVACCSGWVLSLACGYL